MANSFKTLTPEDKSITRTLLHEAIPISGNVVSGTYGDESQGGDKTNIKNYNHQLFQSVYDYPYLSASSNHLFDITVGYSAQSNFSASQNTANKDKINMYTNMAQDLMGYDVNNDIRQFDKDGDLLAGGDKIQEAFFLNFSRLLYKDEIKKGSFSLDLYQDGTLDSISDVVDVNDSGSEDDFRVNSPAGEYGILQSGSTNVGLLFYQAGSAVLTASLFEGEFGQPNDSYNTSTISGALAEGNIEDLAGGLRHRIHDIDFNNSVELNSANYFCRAKNNEFNYSSNPTYTSASKLRVKQNSEDLPVSYITTAGLYSADNELLAVAKLSEPIKKTPEDEVNVRIRLDY